MRRGGADKHPESPSGVKDFHPGCWERRWQSALPCRSQDCLLQGHALPRWQASPDCLAGVLKAWLPHPLYGQLQNVVQQRAPCGRWRPESVQPLHLPPPASPLPFPVTPTFHKTPCILTTDPEPASRGTQAPKVQNLYLYKKKMRAAFVTFQITMSSPKELSHPRLSSQGESQRCV